MKVAWSMTSTSGGGRVRRECLSRAVVPRTGHLLSSRPTSEKLWAVASHHAPQADETTAHQHLDSNATPSSNTLHHVSVIQIDAAVGLRESSVDIVKVSLSSLTQKGAVKPPQTHPETPQ